MSTLHFPIRVPSDVLEALGKFTGNWWSDTLALEPFVCEAIRNYLRTPSPEQEQPAAPTEAGYQWKQVFLPDGTRLRASFDGEYYFAEVREGKVVYDELPMSPSRFANLRGSGNRNAWKAVWLRLPGRENWLLADICRLARKAAIARMLESGAMEALPSQDRKRPPEAQSTVTQAVVQNPEELRQPGELPGSSRQSAGASVAKDAAQKIGGQARSSVGRIGRHKRRGGKNRSRKSH